MVRTMGEDAITDTAGADVGNADVRLRGCRRNGPPQGRRGVVTGVRAFRRHQQRPACSLEQGDRNSRRQVDTTEEALESWPAQFLLGMAAPQRLGLVSGVTVSSMPVTLVRPGRGSEVIHRAV